MENTVKSKRNKKQSKEQDVKQRIRRSEEELALKSGDMTQLELLADLRDPSQFQALCKMCSTVLAFKINRTCINYFNEECYLIFLSIYLKTEMYLIMLQLALFFTTFYT